MEALRLRFCLSAGLLRGRFGLKAATGAISPFHFFKTLIEFATVLRILAHLGLPATLVVLLNLRRWFGGISTFSSLRILRTVE
jgi:hypothetical protein